ncbi:MAG: hypothetical protein H0W21_03150 [Actinobacteria bacterium]|nr:hypothetical protein [Actinomycetota bacterium]
MTTPGKPTHDLERWFGHRIPTEWFTVTPYVRADRDEILVIGELPQPVFPARARDHERALAEAALIEDFRAGTRDERVRIAAEGEHLFGRSVSWGAICGGTTELFTTLSVPVMTRLRMGERGILDTLVEAGVARSRSDALAWCVRLVARHEKDWITELQQALVQVKQVKSKGPN